MALKRERSFPTLSAKPWKDTQWRTHMPQLAVADPYAGAAFPAGGLDPERGGGADDDFFQRADETVQPVRALADAEHGVGYELARKMAGDVAAAICLDDFDAACLQFRPVEEQVLLAAVTSEGDHGRVLHQK